MNAPAKHLLFGIFHRPDVRDTSSELELLGLQLHRVPARSTVAPIWMTTFAGQSLGGEPCREYVAELQPDADWGWLFELRRIGQSEGVVGHGATPKSAAGEAFAKLLEASDILRAFAAQGVG